MRSIQNYPYTGCPYLFVTIVLFFCYRPEVRLIRKLIIGERNGGIPLTETMDAAIGKTEFIGKKCASLFITDLDIKLYSCPYELKNL